MEPKTTNEKRVKTLRPTSQKSIYHSFASLYEKIMNDEIEIPKAEQAINALAGMNRTYALELKRAEVQRGPELQSVIIKNFEIEEDTRKAREEESLES